MDNVSLQKAIELRDSLLAELRQNKTFQAYQHAQAIIAALGAQETPQLPSQQQPNVEKTNSRQSFKPGTQAETVLMASAAYIRQKKARAPSGEILKALTEKGIAVGGQNPSATLSSYLSHSALFDNIRGQGYGLVEWSRPQTETPNSGTLFGAPKTNGTAPLSP
jgi:hypothetical protein